MCQHRTVLTIFIGCFCAVYAAAAEIVLDASAPPQAQVSIISESPREIVLEFRFRSVNVERDVSTGQAWTALSIPGTIPSSRSGLPELPQLSVWLKISGENANVDLLEANTGRRNWGVPRPAPEPLYRSDNAPMRRVANADAYRSSRPFPEQPVEISLIGVLRGTQVALITFSPVQYRASSQEWIVHTRLRARIVFRGTNHLDQQQPVLRSTQTMLQRTVINEPSLDENEPFSNARLLLVTTPEYLPVLQPFIEWKTQSGVPVRTIPYPQAASGGAGLRTYIRTLCDSLTPRPEFLLIVGDVNVIPPFYGVSASLTDHPYSLLDDEDYLPDLSVGRIPCQGTADCAEWVSRLIAYERDGIGAFNGAMVFSSAVSLDPQHGAFVSGLMRNAGLTVDQLQEPNTGTLANLTNSLNSGKSWAFYIGHGYAQGWSSVTPDFTTTSISELMGHISPITVAVACATADLDYPGMSLAEFWLSRPGDSGPLLYFGATESTAFYRSDTLGIVALREVFEHQCERIGTAADLGRMATARSFPQAPGGLTEETIQQFVLLGDPSMRVYSRPPQSLAVTCADVLPIASREIQFTVQKSGVAVAGAMICLASDPPGFYSVVNTGSTGIATIPISFSEPAQLRWTVTATNCFTDTGRISMVPNTGPYVMISDFRISDPEGDNDGNADRSETCLLQLTLQNNGTAISESGSVSVHCPDPRISMTPATINFTPLNVRERRILTETVPFTVSAFAGDNSSVLFRVVVRYGNSDSLVTMKPVTLHAPNMVFLFSSIREDSGDGDGQPEGGERLSLIMRFRNNGGEDLRVPACSLLALPEQLQLINVVEPDYICAPGETLSVSANLRCAPSIPRGMAVEYAYRLAAQNDTPRTGWDIQRIGQVPVYLWVLDPMPQQVDGIASALTSLGIEFEQGSAFPQDPFRYTSIWIFCGVYPNAAVVSATHSNRLVEYLNGGGRCYWEGGDVWAYDTRTALHELFHIRGVNDGTSNIGPVSGEYGSAYAGFRFAYGGENSFIDQLEAEAGAMVMLRNARTNAAFPVSIAYSGDTYRTVGSSIEIGALCDSIYPSTRVHLIHEILRWFGIESRVDIFPPIVQHIPLGEYPLQNQPIILNADVQDASDLDSVYVECRADGGASQRINMLLADGLYRAELPGAVFGTTIRYRIRAVDASPRHNSSATPEYTIRVIASPDIPLEFLRPDATFAGIRPHIGGSNDASWSWTNYPDATPVLEMRGNAEGITLTTNTFDCTKLQQVDLSFWHYLRQVESGTGVMARIIGSIDGGKTFPYPVWSQSFGAGGILDEGAVVVRDQLWAAGQSCVVLRFEFFGNWYWRLRDIRVSGQTAPVTAAVTQTVISVVDGQIRLAWPEIPGALYYIVEASESINSPNGYQAIAQTRGARFVDRDTSYASRYYQVIAVMEEGQNSSTLTDNEAVSRAAQLRIQDFRWNSKIQ